MHDRLSHICRCPDCLIPVSLPLYVYATPGWAVQCHHCQHLFYPPEREDNTNDVVLECDQCGTNHIIPTYLGLLIHKGGWPVACTQCQATLHLVPTQGDEAKPHPSEANNSEPQDIDRHEREVRPADAKQAEKLDLIEGVSAVLLGFCVAGLGVLYLQTTQNGGEVRLWLSAYSQNIFSHDFFVLLRLPFDWLSGH